MTLLKRLRRSRPTGARPRAAGGSSASPIPQATAAALTVELGSLKLSRALPAGFQRVQIEIDMPGPEEPFVSPPAFAIAGPGPDEPVVADIGHARRYHAAAGSPLGNALREAIEARNGDADILFALLALDEASGESHELGAARCSLDELLDRGADLKDEPLQVIDGRGTEMGRLTCSVSAVSVLRSLGEGHAAALPEPAAVPRPSATVLEATPPPDQIAATAQPPPAANRDLAKSYEDLRERSHRLVALARSVQPAGTAPAEAKAVFRRPSGGDGVVIADEGVVEEVRAALSAWDATTVGSMDALVSSGRLTTSQRKLLVHATGEVRRAKQAWGTHKKELRSEREEMADEILHFTRELHRLKADGRFATAGGGNKDVLEAPKADDVLRSGVEAVDASKDVLRSGVARPAPTIKKEGKAKGGEGKGAFPTPLARSELDEAQEKLGASERAVSDLAAKLADAEARAELEKKRAAEVLAEAKRAREEAEAAAPVRGGSRCSSSARALDPGQFLYSSSGSGALPSGLFTSLQRHPAAPAAGAGAAGSHGGAAQPPDAPAWDGHSEYILPGRRLQPAVCTGHAGCTDRAWRTSHTSCHPRSSLDSALHGGGDSRPSVAAALCGHQGPTTLSPTTRHYSGGRAC